MRCQCGCVDTESHLASQLSKALAERDRLSEALEVTRLVARAYIRISELDRVCEGHSGLNDEIGAKAEAELFDLVEALQPIVEHVKTRKATLSGAAHRSAK